MLESIQPVARDHGVSLGQLAIGWTVSAGRATHALIGARTVDQVRESATAGDLELTERELAYIDQQVEKYSSDIPHLL